MFSRLVAFLPVAALAALAVAAPNGGGKTCNSGSVRCCDQKFWNDIQFQPGDDGNLVEALVGAIVDVGITCSPITVIGVSTGGVCNVQTACCEDNTINGLVNVVCSPININL